MLSSLPLPSALPVCDCHFHVFDASQRALDARYVPAYRASLEAWETQAMAVGVTHGVVVQPSFLGSDNRQLLAAISARPATLRGVAVVPPDVTATALRALYQAGVRGIRLNLMGERDDVAVLRARPASGWSALLEAGMHVELHADVGRVASLLPLIPDELTVVLDHCAKPNHIDAQDATVRAVSRRPGITCITLSGAYRQAPEVRAHASELAALWLHEVGPDRLLWGSDWPCTNFETEQDYPALLRAPQAGLTSVTDAPALLSANAQRIYWR